MHLVENFNASPSFLEFFMHWNPHVEQTEHLSNI